MKKFLKQVGNIVAVNAVVGAATELAKVAAPKLKARLKGVLDKVDDFQKRKETKEELDKLVKDSKEHYKKKPSVKRDEEIPPTKPTNEPGSVPENPGNNPPGGVSG